MLAKPKFSSFLNLLGSLNYDLKLLILLSILIILGQMILYSASAPSHVLLEKQLMRLALGAIIMVIAAQIPSSFYYQVAPIVFIIVSLSLFGVLIIGHVSKGAQRWLKLGFISFQPSELMKIACPLMLAWFLNNRKLPPSALTTLLAAIIIIVPTLLIAKQPDLGTALLIFISGAATIFVTGISHRMIGYIALFSTVMLPTSWFLLHDYQRQRIMTLINPEQDPLGSGYHIIQSLIAIGSGGIRGAGWLHGTQSHLNFLPEHTTDFIFSQFTEEFGLIGAGFLLLIYFLILMHMLNISVKSSNVFNKVLSCNLAMIFFCYVSVNIGMVCGLLPVVGIPLPFISYGGTSILTLMVNFGILISIHNSSKNTLYS